MKKSDRDARILAQPPAFSRKAQFALLLLIFAAATVTRLPTFFLNEIGPDESLYFLMAEQWHMGHLPYTTIWDNKPLGIYTIFLLFQDLIGDNIASIRTACVIFVTLTAFAVVNIILLIPNPDKKLRRIAALIGGFSYLLCSMSNDGLESNTEIFMVVFTSFAALCAASPGTLPDRPFTKAAITGLLLGCAFTTKYVAIFEAPALAFALLYLIPPASIYRAIRICAGAIFGGVWPVLLPILLYAHNGEFALWYNHNILANARREQAEAQIGYLFVQRIGEWLPLWCGAMLLVVSPFFRKVKSFSLRRDNFTARFHLFLIVWLFAAFLGVSSAKGFYSHFYIQVLPVLSVVAGWTVLTFFPNIRYWSLMKAGSAGLFLLLFPLFAGVATMIKAVQPVLTISGHHISVHKDIGLLIAQDIRSAPSLRPVKLYDVDFDIIIYSLSKTTPPTRYVFPMFLTTCFLAYVSGVDAQKEETRILALHPQFILRSVPQPAAVRPWEENVYVELANMLATQYFVAKTYQGATLYELRPDLLNSAPPPRQYPSSCPPASS
jgi:hypothetical protein